jgi:hypothetical protein
MKGSNSIKPEFLDNLKKSLNSNSLFELAEASAYLGESGDPQAIEPLVMKAKTSVDWLIQDFAVSALTQLAGALPEAGEALKQIVIIEPPESGHILEIKQTAETPQVIFDFEKGKFILRGKGTGDYENVMEMFKSITNEFESFDIMYPEKPLIASFCIKSMSDTFGKELYKFFRRIKLHNNTIVHWHYEIFGDSMTYVGEDFELIVRMKFVFKEVPDTGLSRDY